MSGSAGFDEVRAESALLAKEGIKVPDFNSGAGVVTLASEAVPDASDAATVASVEALYSSAGGVNTKADITPKKPAAINIFIKAFLGASGRV